MTTNVRSAYDNTKVNKITLLIFSLALSLVFLVGSSQALAQAPTANPLDVTVSPPKQNGGVISGNPSQVLTNAIKIIFIIAAIAVLFMLILGAFQWITSGGDKDAVAKARGRITHALIGLVLLALAVLILRVVGAVVGIDVFSNATLPSLNASPAP